MKPEEVWPPPPLRFIKDKSVKPDGRPKGRLLFCIIGTAVLLSVAFGAVTNAINAALCPDYFYVFLFDQSVDYSTVWGGSILEGVREGAALGLLISAAFAFGASLIYRSYLSYRVAFRCLISILAGAFLAWVLGGLFAVGFAALRPTLFSEDFGLPGGFYAWVFGSLHSIEPGGVASLLIVLVRLYIRRPLVAISDTAAT